MIKHTTREEWLTAATDELRPVFGAIGKPIPAAIRLSCGFPLNAKRSNAIGECWANTASADKTIEILISPVLAAPLPVFETLVHELCHATAGSMNHGVNFQRAAGLMLLEPIGTGKQAFKSTRGTAEFKTAYADMIDGLGDYPHAALTYSSKKVQRTRMLKATCTCGYTIRLTQKWADLGLPVCNCGTTFTI